MSSMPQLARIAYERPRPVLTDIPQAVSQQFATTPMAFPAGAEVAVAVGSRGIANLASIVRTTIRELKARGVEPFIVPAMGSHGGATDQGQADVLAAYGITPTEMDCPVRSSMEVVELDSTGLTTPSYMDRHAFHAEGIVVINRIKPHTDFHGLFESGLVKMIVIGLGKERQAFAMHRHGVHGLKHLVPQTAERILALGKISLGLAVIENAYDETAKVELIPGHQILERESVLIQEAHQHLPRLPVDELDILGVDRLGKDISGTGLDTNVIGRIRIPGQPEPTNPRINAIWVGDLTSASHGNATGMGLADVITERFRSKIDLAVTATNIVTSGFLERAKQPIAVPHDRAAFELCHRAVGPVPIDQLRVARIRDTLHVNELFVSPAILNELSALPEIRVLTPPRLAFLPNGESVPFE